MSVLKSLKGTLLNVQQDLSSGIRSITTPEGKAKPFPKVNIKVEQQAGSDLLNRYQESWGELHQLAEANATTAQEVDSHVNSLYIHTESQNDALSKFLTEASNIPILLEDVQQAISKIGSIELLLSDINDGLIELEDLCDSHDLTNNINHHTHQLSLYKQKKDIELEQFKVSKALEHAHKMEEYERKLQRTLREKQEGLEAAYRHEIDQYRQSGHTQFKPSISQERLGLEDIDLETNLADLDAFLSSDAGKPHVETERSAVDVSDVGGVVSADDDDDDDDDDAGDSTVQEHLQNPAD